MSSVCSSIEVKANILDTTCTTQSVRCKGRRGWRAGFYWSGLELHPTGRQFRLQQEAWKDKGKALINWYTCSSLFIWKLMTHLSKDSCTSPGDIALEMVPMAIAHPVPSCLLTTTLSCTDRGRPCAPTFPRLANSWENRRPSRTAGLATKSARHRPSLSLNARALELATEGWMRRGIYLSWAVSSQKGRPSRSLL